MKNFTFRKTACLLALVALSACSAAMNRPKKSVVQNVAISEGDCKGALSAPNGIRGLFRIDFLKDMDTETFDLHAHGFVSASPLAEGVDPYVVLGMKSLPLKQRYAMMKKVTFKDLGNLQLSLGLESVSEDLPFGKRTLEELQQEMGVITIQNKEGQEVPVAIPMANLGGEATGIYRVKQETFELMRNLYRYLYRSGEVASTLPIRSVALQSSAKGVGVSGANIPALPASTDGDLKKLTEGEPIEIGPPLVIPLEANPDPPQGGVLAVQVESVAQKPLFRATCVIEDKGQSEISIPTTWRGSDGQPQSFREGLSRIILLRSHRKSVALDDGSGAGEVLFETGIGLVGRLRFRKPPQLNDYQ
jgi:hypothetical protein